MKSTLSQKLQNIKESLTPHSLKNSVAAILALAGAAQMQGQTDSRPQNELQVSNVNALGSVNFDAQTDQAKEEILYAQAREMQNSYGVHIDLVYTIIRTNYMAMDITTTGNEINDINAMKTWITNNFPSADPRDLNSGFFSGNPYGGAAQNGADTNGYRYQVIAAPTASWLLGHENPHTLGALGGAHLEGKENITFTATNIGSGAQNTPNNGFTIGNAGLTSGTRLQYLSVSDANNTGNPANGGDGTVKHVGEYFGDEYEISTPYTQLNNQMGTNVADGIANFYQGTGPGQAFRTENVTFATTPLGNVAGNNISLSNSSSFETQFPNTTNVPFQNQFFTEGIEELYLYDATNTADGAHIAGPIGLNDSFAGLANGDYVLRAYEKTSNSLSPASAVLTVGTAPDTTPPVAICQNTTAQLDASGNVIIDALDIDNGSTDNIGIVSYTLSETNFDCDDLGANIVTLTVTDATGNTDSCTATVTIEDPINPEAQTQNVILQLDASGNASLTVADIENGSTDNCTIVSASLSQTTFTCADIGVNNVNYTVVDGDGNMNTASATVTIEDPINPEAQTQNVILQLDASGNASLTVADIENGSTDNCTIVSASLSQTTFTCADIGVNNVNYTVVDGDGNMNTATATVTVEDTINPEAQTQNVILQLDASGNASLTVADIENGSTDNCTIVSASLSQTTFTCADIGVNNVNYTVVDGDGNMNTASATVTIEDTINPNMIGTDPTGNLNGMGSVTIPASSADGGSDDNCDIDTLTLTPDTFTAIGTYAAVLEGTDASGNDANVNVTVTIIDTVDSINPNAICQNLTAQLDASGNVMISASDIDNGSTDNVGIASIAVFPNTFSCNDLGDNPVTLTVTDAAGNTDTCTATVNIEDLLNPSNPANFSISNVTATTAEATSDISVDNCEIAGYKFYQDTTIDGIANGTEVGDVVTPSYDYTALVPDTSYELYNISYDTSGNPSDASNIENITTTLGIENFEIAGFKMYPNPAAVSVTVKATHLLDDIKIYDITGKRVIEINPQGLSEINIHLSQLQSGMYIMNVYDKEGGKVTKKLIKE